MKVDVVLLTKNSLKPCLKECVESIYRNVPVGRLIVVDGGSTDGTVEFLEKLPRVEVIDDSKGNRATARQKGIEAVETEWHLHVDSDVILCKDWFTKASRYVRDDVGAIWGVAVPIEPHTFNIVYAMSKFYRLPVRDLLVKQMRSERCMTHDTLFRTEPLKDIKIPRDLHVWEDDYIGRWVIRKGYRFLKVKDPYCLHNVSEKGPDTAILNGYLLHKYRIWSFKRVLMRFLLTIPKSVWIYAVTKDLEAARRQALTYVLTMKGWLAYGLSL
ncbi:MAG: glycosyltransferase family 2 protein, partial [Candidatus Nezhaarchaeota archaeon]|nr:glycosyltransferase family 2 protein [Candidatus Nezhaarchaeota archaeon]